MKHDKEPSGPIEVGLFLGGAIACTGSTDDYLWLGVDG